MGNIGRGFGLAKPSPFSSSRKTSAWRRAMSASVLALGRLVAEVAEAVDHLLRRAATDAQLQPAAGDEVGRPGVLRHVERVLVAHVDDGRTDLDALRARADGGEQRERRGELAREVVHAEVGAVGAELLGGDRQVDRLEKGVRRRTAPASTRESTSGRTTGTRCASSKRAYRTRRRSRSVPSAPSSPLI